MGRILTLVPIAVSLYKTTRFRFRHSLAFSLQSFFFSFGVDFQHFSGKIYFHYAGGPSDVSNDYECGQNGRGRPRNQGL